MKAYEKRREVRDRKWARRQRQLKRWASQARSARDWEERQQRQASGRLLVFVLMVLGLVAVAVSLYLAGWHFG